VAQARSVGGELSQPWGTLVSRSRDVVPHDRQMLEKKTAIDGELVAS
jgi:hypothetical protein